MFGLDFELLYRPMHSKERSVQDIDFVDFAGGNNTYIPGEGFFFYYFS